MELASCIPSGIYSSSSESLLSSSMSSISAELCKKSQVGGLLNNAHQSTCLSYALGYRRSLNSSKTVGIAYLSNFWNEHLIYTFCFISYTGSYFGRKVAAGLPEKRNLPCHIFFLEQCLQDGYQLAWDDSWCVAGGAQCCYGDPVYLFMWVISCTH